MKVGLRMRLRPGFLYFIVIFQMVILIWALPRAFALPEVGQSERPEIEALARKMIEDRKPFIERYLQNAEEYRGIVSEILKDQGIPERFRALPIVLSGYQIHYEKGDQVGMWAISPEIAKRYGLRVDRDFDERVDPIRATRAYLKYLKDLYNVYQSWDLAVTGSLAGERKILNTVMRAKERDFWKLAEGSYLDKDVKNKVMLLYAASKILSKPEDYGLKRPEAIKWKRLEMLKVPARVSLKKLVEDTDVSLQDLARLNPHLRTSTVPNVIGGYYLWVTSKQ